ncbi:MAG: hypothetical protein IKL89_01355 [Clostridia bacterium]|nr:hypothetical protein [Clostridia bacterium]
MRLKPLLFAAAALAMLILGDIWDSRDIDDLAIYSSEGYDLQDGEVSLHVTGVSSAFLEEGKAKAIVLASEGENLGQSRYDRSLTMPDEIMYGTLRTVLFGKALAQSGIREYVDINFRGPQTRLGAHVAVAGGNCQEIYNAETPTEDIGTHLSEILHSASESSFVPTVTLKDVALTLFSDDWGDALLPLLVPSELGVEIGGLAVFDGDRMVAEVTGWEALALVLLRGDGARGYIPFSANLPGGKVDQGSLFLTAKRRVRARMAEGVPQIELEILLTGALVGHAGEEAITENPQNRAAVERQLAAEMETLCRAALRRVQEEFRCDPINITRFAKPLYRKNPPEDIRDIIDDAVIHVRVRCDIRRLGEVS